MSGKKIFNILRNKYLLTFLGFGLWLLIFDQHNLVDRFKTRQYLKKMVQDTIFYHDKILEDQKIIDQIKTDDYNLEEFARENYLMKADDEDVFIIMKKDEK